MIGFFHVTEFVHHDVVNAVARRFNQLGVQIDKAAWVVTPPPLRHSADLQTRLRRAVPAEPLPAPFHALLKVDAGARKEPLVEQRFDPPRVAFVLRRDVYVTA